MDTDGRSSGKPMTSPGPSLTAWTAQRTHAASREARTAMAPPEKWRAAADSFHASYKTALPTAPRTPHSQLTRLTHEHQAHACTASRWAAGSSVRNAARAKSLAIARPWSRTSVVARTSSAAPAPASKRSMMIPDCCSNHYRRRSNVSSSACLGIFCWTGCRVRRGGRPRTVWPRMVTPVAAAISLSAKTAQSK